MCLWKGLERGFSKGIFGVGAETLPSPAQSLPASRELAACHSTLSKQGRGEAVSKVTGAVFVWQVVTPSLESRGLGAISLRGGPGLRHEPGSPHAGSSFLSILWSPSAYRVLTSLANPCPRRTCPSCPWDSLAPPGCSENQEGHIALASWDWAAVGRGLETPRGPGAIPKTQSIAVSTGLLLVSPGRKSSWVGQDPLSQLPSLSQLSPRDAGLDPPSTGLGQSGHRGAAFPWTSLLLPKKRRVIWGPF